MPAGGFEAFANRFRKNYRHLRKWAKRETVTCFRVYDRDLHDYNVAVDSYAVLRSPGRPPPTGDETHAVVQEYERPPKIDDARAQARLEEVIGFVPEALGVDPAAVHLKVRRRQKSGQYEKLDARGEFHEVREGGHRFLVNFTDYLDTGLFLDHRITRAMIQEMAAGKTFLNLFAYTGTATVYAAKGGAVSTTTVDLSNTYLDWAARNFELNGLSPDDHEIVRADCLIWIPKGEAGGAPARRYGLIFLDPPTFSTSKKMETTFDVQRDHVPLIRSTVRLLAPGGVLIFSNNFRNFEMDRPALPDLAIENVTARTIPEDFKRNPRIHNVWRITRRT